MAKRSQSRGWKIFSRVGITLILLYLMLIILGFAVRLLFFSDKQTASIVPDRNAVASAEEATDSQGSNAAAEASTEAPQAATNENILSLSLSQSFLAVLEGNSAAVSVDMQTTGQASAQDLIWSTSDESIATVDNAGNITGVKAGKCEVIVSVKGNETISQSIPVQVRHLDEKNGCTYIDNILIVNKTYSLPADYAPQLSETAKAAFDQLQADAKKEGLNLYIGSSFRDYDYQVKIYHNYSDLYGWEMADTFSARPGHSEHQTGLTIDCNTIDDAFGETPEATWLAEHCADYGFIIRFPKGKEEITGYKYEPWHIRYVGVETAKEINALGLTLEEYLGVDSAYTGPWEE